MMDWQVLSFEGNDDPQTANIHPPLIEQAQQVHIPTGAAAGFCILLRWRTDGKKMFRDYYFLPEAIGLCGWILIHHPGTFCDRPTGPGLSPVMGCQSFAAQVAANP